MKGARGGIAEGETRQECSTNLVANNSTLDRLLVVVTHAKEVTVDGHTRSTSVRRRHTLGEVGSILRRRKKIRHGSVNKDQGRDVQTRNHMLPLRRR